MTTILDIVRGRIGRRHKITTETMRAILADLSAAGLVELDNGWQGSTPEARADPARAWARACSGITVISVLADGDPMAARLASSNPGEIRYDQPGSMHPQLRATLMFAPPDVDHDYLRRRAKRLLVVVEDEARRSGDAAPGNV